MRFLRTNTAVIITVGPFYDRTDGVTIETALTITNERITLTADTDAGSAPTNILDNVTGATSGTSNDLNYITGNDAGMMQLELAAADVNRLGRMFLSITDAANHVPVFHEFMVVPALVYDTFFASSGGATFPAATLASTTNITAGTITTATNVTTVNGLAANVITAASMAADASAEIADAVWDEDATGHQTTGTFGQAIGDPVADTNTIYKAVVTDATGATVGVDVVAIKAETVSIQADTDNIQTRIPAALVSGRIDASVGAMATDTFTAAALAADAVTEIQSGLATSASIAALNNLSAAQVNTEVDTALVDVRLDELLSADSDIDGAAPPTVGSVFHELMTKTAGSFTYDQTTDSNEALRDRGDAAWITATGFSTLDAAGVRTAIGLASANMDTQLDALPTNAELATALGTADDATLAAIAALNNISQANVRTAVGLASANLDTQLSGINSKTTNLPSDPADQSAVEAAITAAWTTALVESYNADGSPPTPAQALFVIMQRLTEFAISSTTITVKKLDGSTTAYTLTMDSATTPTSSTRAS